VSPPPDWWPRRQAYGRSGRARRCDYRLLFVQLASGKAPRECGGHADAGAGILSWAQRQWHWPRSRNAAAGNGAGQARRQRLGRELARHGGEHGGQEVPPTPVDRLNRAKLAKDAPEIDITFTTSHVGWLCQRRLLRAARSRQGGERHVRGCAGQDRPVCTIGYRPDLVSDVAGLIRRLARRRKAPTKDSGRGLRRRPFAAAIIARAPRAPP
jgi:hypothetical protein